MILIKQYIGEQFKNNTYHFKCDCLVQLDFIGRVLDYEIQDEIVLLIESNNKIIRLGLNHPSLMVEKL